jgi:hypothetical protein
LSRRWQGDQFWIDNQEKQGANDANGSGEHEASHGPVNQIPEEWIRKSQSQRNLQSRLPGQFSLKKGSAADYDIPNETYDSERNSNKRPNAPDS